MKGIPQMLEILPCSNKRIISPFCKKTGVAAGDGHYLYRAVNNGDILAAGLFEIKSDRVVVCFYESGEDDIFLFDGILRAGLNYASGQGIEVGEISEDFRARHNTYFDRLNYPPETCMNIVNFFKKYKNCSNI